MNLGDPSDPLILNLAQSFTRIVHQLDYVTIGFGLSCLVCLCAVIEAKNKSKKIDPRTRMNPFITLAP